MELFRKLIKKALDWLVRIVTSIIRYLFLPLLIILTPPLFNLISRILEGVCTLESFKAYSSKYIQVCNSLKSFFELQLSWQQWLFLSLLLFILLSPILRSSAKFLYKYFERIAYKRPSVAIALITVVSAAISLITLEDINKKREIQKDLIVKISEYVMDQRSDLNRMSLVEALFKDTEKHFDLLFENFENKLEEMRKKKKVAKTFRDLIEKFKAIDKKKKSSNNKEEEEKLNKELENLKRQFTEKRKEFEYFDLINSSESIEDLVKDDDKLTELEWNIVYLSKQIGEPETAIQSSSQKRKNRSECKENASSLTNQGEISEKDPCLGTEEPDPCLESLPKELRLLKGRIEELDKKINGKANQEDLDGLEETVEKKADQSELEGKADTTKLKELDKKVEKKADQSELEGKADTTKLKELEETVEKKADQSELEGKASKEELDEKLDKKTFKNLVNEGANKIIFIRRTY